MIENRNAARVQAAEAPPDFDDDEAADEPPLDRASFRAARGGVPPPTRSDILFELAEADPASRIAAIPKVGSLRPREAIEVIASVFSNEDDATVRSRAVAALTRLDGPSARGLLRERALGDDDPRLRSQALNALAATSGERAVSVLLRALRRDPAPRVRLAALRALGRVGGEWGQGYLARAARDPDPAVATAARRALAAAPQQDD